MPKYLKNTTRFSDVVVTSNIDLTVQMEKREIEKDVYEYVFSMTWDEEQAKDENSQVMMLWSLPLIDVQYMFR